MSVMATHTVSLPTGADARVRNAGGRLAAVLVNGGTGRPVPGTWSATTELLASEIAPRHPEVTFVEVRYRVKSWSVLEACVDDAVAALDLAASGGAERALLVGFSMGGAVSIAAAEHPVVEAVLGLAPWIPDRLPVDTISGKRLDVLHGALDRYLPGIPGVSPALSRRGFERALAAGATGTYRMLRWAVHGAALRAPGGGLVRLPRAAAWVDHTAAAVARLAAGARDPLPAAGGG